MAPILRPATESEYIDLATFGLTNGSSHTGHDGLVGGRTAITTEAAEAYNNLRHFVGLAPATIDEVGAWAFANGLTNNSQAWGTDQQGVGLWYSMQGAKAGWMADDTFDPQVVADIERTARLGSEEDVMTMVAEYGHDGFADYLTDNGFDQAFINTLKMEPHYAGWMHDRAHGRLSIEGAATAHDVNHLTVLSHDQMQPFMNDTWDYPRWPALDVSHERVLEYFQSMVVLGDPLANHLSELNGPPNPSGLPSVSIGDAVGAEGNSGSSDLGFTVSLSEASSDAVTVGYTTANGTATAGSDYTANSGTVSFAPGVISQQLNVAVLGDTAVESNETFTVTLSNPTGATLAAGAAIGTITNDDVATPAPGVSSVVHTVGDDWGSGHVADIILTAGDSSINGWTLEFDAPVEITNAWNAEIVSSADGHHVLRNAAWNGVLGAGQSANPGYQATPGGAAAAATNFKVNGVAVGTPGPTPQLPSVSIGDAVGAEGNSGSSDLGFTVSLSEASSDAVTVGYTTANGTATAGSDYTANSGTVSFAPGVISQQLNVAVLGDTAVESNETFTVTLSNPTGATLAAGAAIGTITNDDVGAPPPPSTLSISDASAAENSPGDGGIAPGYLSTSGNQIIDSQENTVKLSGVNWFGGETPNGVPHGLWTRNYQDSIDQMAAEGFNTIRLPYSNEMLHSAEAPTGIDFFQNPELQGMSRLQVMDEVIRYAGEKDMRVILDQHRSSAGAGPNGNGLWFDGQYTEDNWVADWQFLAQRYLGNSTVIGADLANEPHSGTWGGGGATDWARAAERAGNAVLAVNPDLLIIVEGVETYQGQNYWWGGNLMGVRDRPIVLDVPNRVVYSPHDYPNSVFPQPWFEGADFAAGLPDKYEQMWGYIYEENIAPIMIGEFGTKLVDPKDEPWFEAITSYMSGDLDNDGTIDIPAGIEGISWTYWSWNPNSGDTGGILADDWNTVNENKMVYLEPIQYDTDGGGNAVARFTITLASASTQPVTVQYTTSNGTANAGTDYVAAAGAITFAPGVTSQTVEVQVLADTLVEPDESFSVTLSNPTGATITDGVGAGTIIDGGVL